MTRNTLAYLTLKETERSNRVKESQQNEELARKRDELSETMRNNLRNYGINLSKNEIQRLANDQLNTRDSNRILAQIQDNLANQKLKLQQNLETERNNREKNRIESELNDIKRMDTLLSAAKATGKTPTAMLMSWFLNQSNLQAFAGTNNFNEYAKQLKDWLEGGDEAIKSIKSDLLPDQEHVTNAQLVANDLGYDPISRHRRYTLERDSSPKTLSDYKNAYLTDAAYDKKSRRSIWKQHKEEENEIPNDFSNSYGPKSQGGKQNEAFTSEIKTSSQNGNSNTGISTTKGSDSYKQSDSGNSSGSQIIWSGSTKSKEEKGPGIGLAFY